MTMYLLKKNYKFILLLLLLNSSLLSVSFRGRVIDQSDNKPVAGVDIMVFEERKFYKTDADGYFEGEVQTSGTYTFRILLVTGMKEVQGSVAGGQTLNLYIGKKKRITPKGGITVAGKKEKTVLSRHKVTYEEIKRMPGTMGEALKGLETLPGITAPPFGGGNIVVRGANPDSNIYLYDDLPILYPFHFIGLNAVVHNDLINSIDLYTGAYPAYFGNATGGVIEITPIDKVDKTRGQFSMSLFSTNAMFQTRLGDKGYAFGGARVSYLEKTIGAMGIVPDGIRMPQYYDGQFKIAYNVTQQHQLSFISLVSNDGFAINAPTKLENDPTKDPLISLAGGRAALTNGFSTLALRHTWTPGNKISNRLTLIRYDPFANYNIQVGSFKANGYARGMYSAVKDDLVWNASKYFKMEAGGEYRLLNYQVTGTTVRPADPTNPSPNIWDTANPAFIEVPQHQKVKAAYSALYTDLHFQAGNFKFEPGVRYDHMGITDKSALGPRFVTSYRVEKIRTLFYGGAGDYYHYPLNDSFTEETGNPDLEFEKATKYSGGFETNITDIWSFKAEVFKQEFDNLIVEDPYISSPIGMNPDKYQWLTDPVVENRPLYYSNKGDGWAHGYELMIKKANAPGKRDWFGWVNYTWSQTFRNNNIHEPTDEENNQVLTGDERRLYSLYNNSKETLYEYDQTHIVNLVYGWRINDDWQIGARWQYRTSYPYTPITGDDGGLFSNPANDVRYWNPKYSKDKNSKRFAPYHRLDIRIDKFLNYEWGYMNMFVEIINFYTRENQTGESFNNTQPYSTTNPSPSYDFSTLQSGSAIIPLINIGLEARF